MFGSELMWHLIDELEKEWCTCEHCKCGEHFKCPIHSKCEELRVAFQQSMPIS